MECLIDPQTFVGRRWIVEPDGESVVQEFEGLCIGVRNGFPQIRDACGDVFEVEINQLTPALAGICKSGHDFGQPNPGESKPWLG